MIAAMMSSRWLSRYLAGEREQVWQDMRQLGSTVRERSDLAEEAQAVCDEMARRARHNVEVIIERLSDAGYRFHANDDEQTPVIPHVAPTPTADEHANWLQERFEAVPMALLSWTRVVGDVWLVGTHPQWPDSASGDPLVIEVEGARYPGDWSIRDSLEDEWNDWRLQSAADPDAAGPFVLALAPDQLHKENTSGGSPYGIIVPDGSVEGLFVGKTTTPFVSYLNWAFCHGGFPETTGSESEWRVKQDLARDLLPL
jgi:hypothetical protein